MLALNPATLLAELQLGAAQLEGRRAYIGSSDASIIGRGDRGKINRLAQAKRGGVAPEDLSGVLPVVMGQFTEALNIAWFSVTQRRPAHSFQKVVGSPDYPFIRATLDAMTVDEAGAPATLECKHVKAFSKIDEVVARYLPPAQHGPPCTGLKTPHLSVFLGTLKYECRTIARDDWYITKLLDAERAFWASLQWGRDPQPIVVDGQSNTQGWTPGFMRRPNRA